MSMTKFTTAIMSLIATASASPLWTEGACPVKSQNKEDFELSKISGLWFEYLTEDNFQTDMSDYVCSSFMWLTDPSGPFTVYQSFMFPSEEEEWAIEQRRREALGLPLEEEEDEDLEAD